MDRCIHLSIYMDLSIHKSSFYARQWVTLDPGLVLLISFQTSFGCWKLMLLSCRFRSFSRAKEKLAKTLPAEKWFLLSVLFAALVRGTESFGSQQNVPSSWKINTTACLRPVLWCRADTLSVAIFVYTDPRVPALSLPALFPLLLQLRLIIFARRADSLLDPIRWLRSEPAHLYSSLTGILLTRLVISTFCCTHSRRNIFCPRGLRKKTNKCLKTYSHNH